MDAVTAAQSGNMLLTCVNMHTTGEPTRIIISGYPDLSGTLLEQRAEARAKHDHIRKRLMLEPAGHADMYGAILRKKTELTQSGEAHIGVLFVTNEDYSTMCGHATIALGRLLVDTQDLSVFPRRKEVKYDPHTKTAVVNLHAPCGLVRVTVPTTEDGTRSDPSRPVTFVNVPSFATGKNIKVDISGADGWPELGQREHVTVSFCYGGAFTCLVSVEELGFDNLKQPLNHAALTFATRNLKSIVNGDPRYQKYMTHPEHDDLSSLYTLIVVDENLGLAIGDSKGAETGLCYFADQQIDRSPTGSATAARVAFAFAAGELSLGESWTYHSLVSNASNGRGGFVGTVLESIPELYDEGTMLGEPVRVQVAGQAFYVGTSTYISEDEDPFGSGGFLFNSL
ncbi:putative proline racemase [Karstenula rhodostoma CBS 690.94]|uniref:trans-L-3-hydroxyproline dehydratase n=1 Tax=Karstenula rhodostoma CBS 690.94 TaxID=1392251 RepID=A0A9P4PSG4_9PLEO|nr:putative proline racemase [Karstenula rhodostoma CBS 690.94]